MNLHRQRMPWGWEITGFGRPMGLGIGTRKHLLVTDMDAHVLVRLDASLDTYQCHAGTTEGWRAQEVVREGRTGHRARGAPSGFNGPHAALVDASGRLIVTCYHTPRIIAIDSAGQPKLLAGEELLRGPATTRLDNAGRLLVAEYALHLLLRLDAAGCCLGRLGLDPALGLLRFAPGVTGVPATHLAGGFDRLHMAIEAPDGSLLVADTWNHRLQRFGPDGAFEALLDGPEGWRRDAPAAERGSNPTRTLDCPVALDRDPQARLLVTCWGREEVLLLGPDGRGHALAGLPALSKPYDARFFGNGVVVADTHNGRVLLVDNLAEHSPETQPQS